MSIQLKEVSGAEHFGHEAIMYQPWETSRKKQLRDIYKNNRKKPRKKK
jgi:hypothetical protein